MTGRAEVSRETLMRIATAYLARYASSSARLRQVLARRVTRRLIREGHDAPDRDAVDAMVCPVVEHLQQIGLVDDAVFARGKAASLAAKGRPAWRIRADLAHGFGIDAEASGVADALDALDPSEQARRWAQRRRLGPFRSRGREEKRDRDVASLVRAGFPLDVARAVIDGDAAAEGPDAA